MRATRTRNERPALAATWPAPVQGERFRIARRGARVALSRVRPRPHQAPKRVLSLHCRFTLASTRRGRLGGTGVFIVEGQQERYRSTTSTQLGGVSTTAFVARRWSSSATSTPSSSTKISRLC